MSVITHASSVFCRVIIAKDLDLVSLPERDLENKRDQMCFRPVIFAETLRGAGGVEVSKADAPDIVDAVIPFQDLLKNEFRLTVGVARILLVSFRHRDFLRFAIDGRGGGKHKPLDTVLNHGIEEFEAVHNVGLKIPVWVRH